MLSDCVKRKQIHQQKFGNGGWMTSHWCRIPMFGEFGLTARRGSQTGSQTLLGVGTEDWKASLNTLRLMVRSKEYQEEMRLVAGLWCSLTRQRRRAVVCNLWYDAGGFGSAQNDHQSRVKGLHCGICKLDWSFHHPHCQCAHY